MSQFRHERHKPPTPLTRPRELVVACAPMRSNVNLSRILRAAGCSGVRRVVACGAARVIGKIARDGAEEVQLDVHRTLPPVLRELKQAGYSIVALEQSTGSRSIYDFAFPRQSVLVVGNERTGLTDEELRLADCVVEIPVYGMPHSHNAATAAAISMYEYCRQYPDG